jgi:molybdenum cofactor cytidylyltransferase
MSMALLAPGQAPTRVGAVLLAAGASRRFGAADKLLAPLAGKPLVRWTAEAVSGSSLAPVVVVTGPDPAPFAAALAGLTGLRFVPNPDAERGMGTSIAAGIAALGAEGLDGAAVVPGDMPLLSTALIDALAAAFRAVNGGRIVYAAAADGAQRNPVLWPARHFADLARLDGAGGGKAILAAHAAEGLAVPNMPEWRLADIDTPADLDDAARRLAEAE